MSAAHTEGLLAIAPGSYGTSKLVLQLDQHLALAAHMREPDARRLAACWNAFDGMPTEAPEELAEIGGVQGLANDLSAAIDVIEAARTLLSDALETFDEYLSADHEVADRIRAFLKGGAA